MRLEAGCEITLELEAPTPLMFMLRPRSGEGQWVTRQCYELSADVPVVEFVDSFGNLCQRLVAPAGEFAVSTSTIAEVAPEIDVHPGAPLTPVQDLPDYTIQFLLPSRYCQSDVVNALAMEIVQGAAPGYDQAEAIRAWVNANVRYCYGTSDASTSAQEIIDQRVGVCRDFAHLGAALCRSLNIPARMVVGYLHGLKPMDLHAWFEAFVGGRWYTFDATQAEPKGGRIAVAYGRDAADVALITQFGPAELKNMRVWVNGQADS